MSRTVQAELLGHRFRFQTRAGLFSGDRVDDGTRLLLDHLPSAPPRSVLDLGCGYGALGLPIAATHPGAECLLVDRLTGAVAVARSNAEAHRLRNVTVQPSLGYRDIDRARRFDWILCNVPARIGPEALAHFLSSGARRLSTGGALHAVVIHDLAEVVESIAAQHGWPLRQVGEGARHRVYGLPALSSEPEQGDPEDVYARDTVHVGAFTLERPQDVSEDPVHARDGLPLLLDLLPRQPDGDALVWRGGYGASAVNLAARGAQVVAADVDLLSTTFTRRNAVASGLAVTTRDVRTLPEAGDTGQRFRLVVGEVPTTGTPDEVRAELAASTELLAPGGQALWLGLHRKSRRLFEGGTVLATRGTFTVWRLGPRPGRGAGKRSTEH